MNCFRAGYRAALSFGIWAVVAINPLATLADQPTGLVQITCVPEVGYFSARLFQVFNIPQKPLKELRPLFSSITGAHRIYTAIELEANPFEYDLAGGDGKQMKFHALGHYDASSPAGGPRNIVNNVEITADRRSLGRLHIGFPWGPIDLMEVLYNGVETRVVTCSYYEHVGPESKQGCTSQSFAAVMLLLATTAAPQKVDETPDAVRNFIAAGPSLEPAKGSYCCKPFRRERSRNGKRRLQADRAGRHRLKE